MERKTSDASVNAPALLCGAAGGALPLVWAVICGCLGYVIAGYFLFWAIAVLVFLLLKSSTVRQAVTKSVTAGAVYITGLILLLKTGIVQWVFSVLCSDYAAEYGSMSPGHSFGITMVFYPASFMMLAAVIFLSVTRASEKQHDMEEKK